MSPGNKKQREEIYNGIVLAIANDQLMAGIKPEEAMAYAVRTAYIATNIYVAYWELVNMAHDEIPPALNRGRK